MKYLVILFFSLITISGYAQLIEKELPNFNYSSAKLATQDNHTITLPFWDDFSTGIGLVDTAWWTQQSQAQVIVKTGIGIDPPSVGVATFDGIDASGTPYLPSPTDGAVDSLVSQYIDLTQVPISLRNTIYISFFYQYKGLGEGAEYEDQDSLFLYFKNIDGFWDKVWPKNTNDTYNINTEVFTEVFTQVQDAKYFHPEFQFMFKARGRQNGWVDNWLVDYVYMDKRRSATDNSYLDRTFTSPPSSIFDQYTAIPFDDFVATVEKGKLFQSTNTKLRNLENALQPVEYSAILFDTLNDVLIESITTDQELILFQKDLVEINSEALNPTLIDTSADSLYVMLEYAVNSGDKFLIDSINGIDTVFYSHINLKQNDTTRSYFALNDYYAYDDGTAEYGAGINQAFGKIAYQYEVVTGKYLDRIDIYFPNIEGNQTGTPLELFILNDFEGTENSLLQQSNIAISHTGINQFIQYEIGNPIFVTDTFYIGLTNLSSNEQWLSIGLDKNTDSYNKIFVNVDGTWVANTEVHGSLMMRPHFTNIAPILGILEDPFNSISVYPNPSAGKFKIEGPFNSVKLLSLLGKEVPFIIVNGNEILFNVTSPQMLILLVETDKGNRTKRIFATPANQ